MRTNDTTFEEEYCDVSNDGERGNVFQLPDAADEDSGEDEDH